jgi:hypothetical protein
MIEIYAASKKLAPSEFDILEKTDKGNKPQPSEEVQVKAINLWDRRQQQDHHDQGEP